MTIRPSKISNHFTPALSPREPEGCLLSLIGLAALFGLALAALALAKALGALA
jgi:hypothetical protein